MFGVITITITVYFRSHQNKTKLKIAMMMYAAHFAYTGIFRRNTKKHKSNKRAVKFTLRFIYIYIYIYI